MKQAREKSHTHTLRHLSANRKCAFWHLNFFCLHDILHVFLEPSLFIYFFQATFPTSRG